MIIAANISALHVLEFSTSIAPNTMAYEVPCQPSPDKLLNDCFPIVAEQVVASGGQQIFGWAFWELPGVFIEAEFHSVWKSPEGDVADIVPRLRPFTKIAFVPDASRRYENRQVDNIRKQLVTTTTSSAFCSCASADSQYSM